MSGAAIGALRALVLPLLAAISLAACTTPPPPARATGPAAAPTPTPAPAARVAPAPEAKAVDAEVDAIFAGRYEPMPPLQADPSRARRTGPSEIEVENQTPYTLTLRYSGPSSRRVVLPSSQKSRIQLDPGDYRVAASVEESARITPFAGRERIDGGMSYSSRWFISTRPAR